MGDSWEREDRRIAPGQGTGPPRRDNLAEDIESDECCLMARGRLHTIGSHLAYHVATMETEPIAIRLTDARWITSNLRTGSMTIQAVGRRPHCPISVAG